MYCNDLTTGVARRLTQALFQRLSSVEDQLSRLIAGEAGSRTVPRSDWRRPSVSPSEDIAHSPPSTSPQNAAIPDADGQIFAGESSIGRAIEHLEEHTPNAEQANNILTPESNQHSLLQQQTRGARIDTDSITRKSLQDLFDSHTIVPDETQWRIYLTTYLRQVHVLYPFLHPPSLWEIFDQLWEHLHNWPAAKTSQHGQSKLKLSLLLLCIAIGRCTGSSRVENSNGTESAGWNIYSVAVTLLGHHLDVSKTGPKSLTGLQVLVLMVVYLFRLDANQQAARILATVISESQSVGLHREKTFKTVPMYHAEMSRRLWWSIYVLDRRIALETGRPFFVQDFMVDTALASELSDERLARMDSQSRTSTDVRIEIPTEGHRAPTTAIPYLNAMVKISRIVAKAWEIAYGARSLTSVAAQGLDNYVETLLDKFQDDLPQTLRFDSNHKVSIHLEDRTLSQTQQAVLLYMVDYCCTFTSFL